MTEPTYSYTGNEKLGHEAVGQRVSTLGLVFKAGGPGFCQFAVTSACNANCGFCNFARDRYPKHRWKYVTRQQAFDAIAILYREGVRYLVITGGEPTLHPDLADIVRHGTYLGMKVMVVTNAGLLGANKIRSLHAAGLSSLIISIDAASREAHEDNRGLPNVCAKIRQANELITQLGMHATASITMSRLVDYDALPDFLTSLGFTSAVFSYPPSSLASNFLGYSDSQLEDYELGRRFWTSGRQVRLVPYLVDVVVDLNRWQQWWTHQVYYWDQNTRFARPGAFFATVLVRAVPFAMLYWLLRGVAAPVRHRDAAVLGTGFH